MVPWDTLGVDRGPICQGPTDLFSPPHFLGSLKGPETPPGGRLLGEFNFYWPSLQPPVSMTHAPSPPSIHNIDHFRSVPGNIASKKTFDAILKQATSLFLCLVVR